MKRFFDKLRWRICDVWSIFAMGVSLFIMLPMLLIKPKEYSILSDNDYEDYDED